MAQTIKLKRSASQGAAPSTSNLELGEVAINTYDGKMYIKKDVGGTESIVEIGGGSTVSYLEAGMIEYEYTATSNQTTFSGSDTNSATLSYTANSIMVFLNGVLQDDGVDYTATNGTSVVFTSALTANDEVRIVAFTNVTTSGSLQDPTKLDAITTVNAQAAYSLTLDSSAYVPSSQNALIVSLNGITQEPGDSFTISGSTITFSPALVTGDVVDYIVDMGRAVTIGEYSGDLAVGGELEVTGDIIGDIRGSVLFKAQAGESLAKGDVVYISGISGNTTVVSKADADDAAKMPAFGVVADTASSGNPVDIYTFGTLSGLDTSSFSEGDELFVSTTAGTLTNSAPAGESAQIQKIAKVTRSHNSSGSIKIMGAGRSNATPNLDNGNIFIGNASNQAVTAALDTSIVPENGNLYYTNTRVDSHLSGGTGVTYNAGEISIGQDVSTTSTPTFGNITTTGYIAGPSTFTIDPAAVGDNTGTLVVAGNLQVDGTTTTINSTTMTVDDLNITLASGAANAAAANGAGITVDGASATLTYNGTNDDWNFNKTLNVTGNLTSTGDVDLSGSFKYGNAGISASDADTASQPGFYQTSDLSTATNYPSSIGGSGPASLVTIAGHNVNNHTQLAFGLNGNNAFLRTYRANNYKDWLQIITDDGSGNVGIGETDPDTPLHITSTSADQITLQADSTTIGPNIVFANNDGNLARIASAETNTLRFEIGPSNTEAMRIDSEGRVNIGTGAPDTNITYGIDNQGFVVARYDLSAGVPTAGLGGVFSAAANVTDFSSGDLVLQSRPGVSSRSIKFFTGNTSTERMRIKADGNVGIGTKTPTKPLHIYAASAGATTTHLNLQNNSAVAGTAVEIRLAPSPYDNDIGSTARWSAIQAISGGSGNPTNLAFLTNGISSDPVERMRIDSSGNILQQTNNGYIRQQSASTYFYQTPETGAKDFLVWDTNQWNTGYRWEINNDPIIKAEGSSQAGFGYVNAADAYYFNSTAVVTYNNNNTWNTAAYYLQNHMNIVSIQHSAGTSNIIVLANGGSGVAYDFQMSDPDSGTFTNTNSVTFTMAGTGGGTYSVQLLGGSGTLQVNRTAGSGSFTVYVNRILGAI